MVQIRFGANTTLGRAHSYLVATNNNDDDDDRATPYSLLPGKSVDEVVMSVGGLDRE